MLTRLLLAVTATFLWLLALSLLLSPLSCSLDSPTAPADPVVTGSSDARTRPIERPSRGRTLRALPSCSIIAAIPPIDGQYFAALKLFRPPNLRVDEIVETSVQEYSLSTRVTSSDEFTYIHVPIKCNGTVGRVRLRGWSSDWSKQHWTLEFVDAEYRGQPPTCR